MADKNVLKHMLKSMIRIRKFEEKTAELFRQRAVHGTTHLYIGEEAIAAGVCAAMQPQDMMTSTHRGHGHCIAKGMDLRVMMAELMGRETGCCKGRGGSMHFADIKNGNLGENGVVGGGHCMAVGAALVTQKKKIDRIVVCFFGDGATNEGTWHEAANLASVWKLPVLFVCENNRYGFSMSLERSMNVADIAVRASAFGFPGKTIDGDNAVEVYEETKKARAYVKENGPMLLVCNTHRVMGHSKSDSNEYRNRQELDECAANDPIPRMKGMLLENGFSQQEIDTIEGEAATAIEDAVKFAEGSPYPPLDTIMDNVYAPAEVQP